MRRQTGSYRLVVDQSPDPVDVALIEERLATAVVDAAGVDEHELAVFVRDDEGEVLGGVSGVVLGRCCELEGLWVDEAVRGRGLARALMAAAEAEARSRGCTLMMFLAYDALTRGLYERLGYRTAGVIEDCLAGGAVRWYAKDLSVS